MTHRHARHARTGHVPSRGYTEKHAAVPLKKRRTARKSAPVVFGAAQPSAPVREILFGALADGAVLFCALAGFIVSFFSLYAGKEMNMLSHFQTTALNVCAKQTGFYVGMAGLFGAVSLAAWSLPRFSGIAAGLLTAGWGAAVWQRFPQVQNGAAASVRPVAGALGLCFGTNWDIGAASRPGSLSTQHDARLFLLLFLAGLALALGWAVVRARSWWAAAAFSLPPLLPALLLGVLPSFPALTALAAAWCALLLGRLCRYGAPMARARLTGAALAGCALFLCLLLAVLPHEDYKRPAWARALNDRLSAFTGAFSLNPTQQKQPSVSGGTRRAGSAGRADLSHAGPLRFSGRTVLRVTTDYSGRLYLRGASLASYRNGVWLPLSADVYDEMEIPMDTEGTPISPLVLPATFVRRSGEYTATVEDVGSASGHVFLPYFPILQDWDETGLIPVDDAYFARQGLTRAVTASFASLAPNALLSPDSIPYEKGSDEYQNFVTQQYTPIPDRYQNFVIQHYTQISRDMRDALLSVPELLQPLLAYDDLSAVTCAERVADALAALCTYDPNTPAAPSGEDPVLWFLTESRRGYCMHYASAAVLILRAMGLPARYVSGYVADCVPGERMDVPDRAAHAWAEVWVHSLGWYPIEVTPAAAMDLYTEGILPPESEQPSADSKSADNSGAQDVPDSASSDSLTPAERKEAEAKRAALRAWERLFTGAGGLFMLLWLGHAIPKRYRAWRLRDTNPNRAAIYAYRCLRRLRRWGGRMEPRAAELAQKARFSQHRLSEEEVNFLRGALERQKKSLQTSLFSFWRILFWYIWG